MEGATLAADSRIHVSGFFSLDELEVDVDGQLASLAEDPDFAIDGSSTTYRVQPSPSPDSIVTLRYCGHIDTDDCGEGAQSFSWTVGEPDTQAPAPVEDLEFGTYDHQDVDTSGNSCSTAPVIAVSIYAHARLPASESSGTPRFALAELLDGSTMEVQAAKLHDLAEVDGEELDVEFRLPEGVLSEPLEEAVCMRVTVLDLAGLRSEAVVVCDPHHVVADPEQGVTYDPYAPDEPEWEDFADAPAGRGCACGTHGEPDGSPIVWGLGLIALGLVGRRRRGR